MSEFGEVAVAGGSTVVEAGRDVVGDVVGQTAGTSAGEKRQHDAEPAVASKKPKTDQPMMPEILDADEDEIMLMNLTDKTTNKLDILRNIDTQKLYAMHPVASKLVERKYEELLQRLKEMKEDDRFDLSLVEHRLVKFIFTFIMRCDGTYNDMREFDRMHHFCLISTPKSYELKEAIERNVCLMDVGGRRTLSGHFIALLERTEAKNAQRVTFTAYRFNNQYLKNLLAKKLQLPNSRTLFFREVLPKATKNHQILRGHDKYVVAHISLGEVTTSILPPRTPPASEDAASIMLDVAEQQTSKQRYATYVRVFINTILSYCDE